jgi:phosphomethylpyrimidine synthase
VSVPKHSVGGPKFCSMKITQDVRDCAKEHGFGESEVLVEGMEEKVKEFCEQRGEVYRAG